MPAKVHKYKININQRMHKRAAICNCNMQYMPKVG